MRNQYVPTETNDSAVAVLEVEAPAAPTVAGVSDPEVSPQRTVAGVSDPGVSSQPTSQRSATEKQNSATEEWTGQRCEKCEAPLKHAAVTICRSCGWYASLGTFVEVDANWETEQEDSHAAAPAGQPSHIKVWLSLLPWWAWVILGSMLAVVVESAIVRLVTPSGVGGLRTTWSLMQLTIGILALAGFHIFNFVVQAAEDADMGVMDILIKPVKVWLRACGRLPTKLWVVDGAACGLTAAAMSILLIGALPYERLWDWGFTPPPKQDLIGAIVDRAKNTDGGSDNLEDAIDDFAGSAGVEGESGDKKPTPPPKREKADCVILGYRIDRDGRLTQVILGTAHLGRLVYAGTVTPKLSDEEARDLLELLTATRIHDPFIAIEAEALWVKPKYACRVTHAEKQPDGRLIDAKWDALVGMMRM